jgi:hypothetical protein
MCAETLRSSQTLYATAVSRMPMTAADLMIEIMMKVVMLNVCPCGSGHSAREPLTLSLGSGSVSRIT